MKASQLKLQRRVLKAQRYTAFRWALKLYYKTALAWFKLSLKILFPQIESIHLQRGMLQPHWVPGASDIDLWIILKSLKGVNQEVSFLQAFWKHYQKFKARFPFLGEVQILEPREVSLCLNCGGIRAREQFQVFRRPPQGKPAPAGGGGWHPPQSFGHQPDSQSSPACWKFRWDALSESLFSCLFLLEQTYFGCPEPDRAPDYGFKIAKGASDTLRYAASAASQAPHPIPGRISYLESAPLPPKILRLLRAPQKIEKSSAWEILCHALQSLDRAAQEFVRLAQQEGEPQNPLPVSERRIKNWAPPLPNTEMFLWHRRLKPLDQEGFPKISGFYFDSLLRWHLIVENVYEKSSLQRLCRHLEHLHRNDPLFQAPPWILSKNIFQALLWSIHLDTPFFYYALSPHLPPLGIAGKTRSRYRLLGWGQRAQWKMAASDFLPPPPLFLEFAVQGAASNLTRSLRLFGLETWAGDNTYRLAFLYSRLLSLFLYLRKKLLLDPEDLDQLLWACEIEAPELFKKIEPSLSQTLAQSSEEFNERPASDCFYAHYPAFRLLLDSIHQNLASPASVPRTPPDFAHSKQNPSQTKPHPVSGA